VIQNAKDYDAFFDREMEFRRTMAYPPAATLVNLILRARDSTEGAAQCVVFGPDRRRDAGLRLAAPGQL
jgi:primosomal protein N'